MVAGNKQGCAISFECGIDMAKVFRDYLTLLLNVSVVDNINNHSRQRPNRELALRRTKGPKYGKRTTAFPLYRRVLSISLANRASIARCSN